MSREPIEAAITELVLIGRVQSFGGEEADVFWDGRFLTDEVGSRFADSEASFFHAAVELLRTWPKSYNLRIVKLAK